LYGALKDTWLVLFSVKFFSLVKRKGTLIIKNLKLVWLEKSGIGQLGRRVSPTWPLDFDWYANGIKAFDFLLFGCCQRKDFNSESHYSVPQW
jgi:hypothetical protein